MDLKKRTVQRKQKGGMSAQLDRKTERRRGAGIIMAKKV